MRIRLTLGYFIFLVTVLIHNTHCHVFIFFIFIDVLCIYLAIFVMVWHRFTDNSSQYWVSIIRQILGKNLVNRLEAAYLFIKLLSSSCYLLAPIHKSGFSFHNFANIGQFMEICTVQYTESYRLLHTVCIQFYKIFPPKNMKMWQIKATHSTLSSVPLLRHLVNWYYWHFTKSCINIVQKCSFGGFSKIDLL